MNRLLFASWPPNIDVSALPGQGIDWNMMYPPFERDPFKELCIAIVLETYHAAKIRRGAFPPDQSREETRDVLVKIQRNNAEVKHPDNEDGDE